MTLNDLLDVFEGDRLQCRTCLGGHLMANIACDMHDDAQLCTLSDRYGLRKVKSIASDDDALLVELD